MYLPALLAVARGDQPADLLLRNARIVNVFSGRVEEGDVALAGGRIAGVGTGYSARAVADLQGAYLAPALIDAHVHIESSLCIPGQFAAAVLPRGVTCVVSDPHEIANVAGLSGIRFMVEAARGLPLAVKLMASSCVPATPMETSGAALDADALATLLDEPSLVGLAEVMNFPGVINGAPEVLAKLSAFAGRPLDGHLPLVTGRMLNAYVAAGIGSEHECVTVAEAEEKLARGLYILIREATNARNLHALLPMITPANSRRICFCTDDRVPADLLDEGTIDYMVAEAIRFGVAPVTALQMATLNPSEWFGLRERGAIAPGRVADLIVFDNLADFHVRQVYSGGRLVAQDGALLPDVVLPQPPIPAAIAQSVHVNLDALNLRIPARGRTLRVIGARDRQLVTDALEAPAHIVNGEAIADSARDLLKMAVIERHTASGGMALGFIQGFGLQRGAIAGTVAHDHHNLVVIGADDISMRRAAQAVAAMGGGLALAEGDAVIAALSLPVAGIMSDQPIAAVRAAYDGLLDAAHARGSELHDPYMAMSFMALEVIPTLKLTDRGLVNVELFDFVDLFVD